MPRFNLVFKGDKFKPTDTLKGMATEISVAKYKITRDAHSRVRGGETTIGYVKENPREALRGLFSSFNITSFNGYEFFPEDSNYRGAPMIGLSLSPVENNSTYGLKITGDLKGLTELRQMKGLGREESISMDLVRRINATLYGDMDDHLWEQFAQTRGGIQFEFDVHQIMGVLNRLVRK